MTTSFSRQSFLMTEIVMALALLMLLSACFIVSLNSLRRWGYDAVADRQALAAVDNTLERLAVMRHYDAAAVRRVFDDELTRSGADSASFQLRWKGSDAHLILTLLRANGKTLIEVPVPCPR